MTARILAKHTCYSRRFCRKRESFASFLPLSQFLSGNRITAVAICFIMNIFTACKHRDRPTDVSPPQEASAARRAPSTSKNPAVVGSQTEQNKSQQTSPRSEPTEATAPGGARDAAQANRSFDQTSISSTISTSNDETLNRLRDRKVRLQWGLSRHTDLSSLEFVPISQTPTANLSGTGPQVNSSAPNITISTKTNQQKSAALLSKKTAAFASTAQRRQYIRRQSLPVNYIQALQLSFGKSGDLRAINSNGHLILNTDTGINFTSGSTALTDEAREIAQHLLRLYAETLMREMQDDSRTILISINGYTSPSLDSTNALSRNANRRISRQRADMIRGLILDLKILKNTKLAIDGRGSASPILRADMLVGPCGVNDCERSRRVELEAQIK